MHILCPHCRNGIELVTINAREEIVCLSCGSTFHLETGSTIASARNQALTASPGPASWLPAPSRR
jgi:transposase-like protein